MSKDELLIIKKYIDEYLNKGFISSSLLPIAVPVLFTKKLGGGIYSVLIIERLLYCFLAVVPTIGKTICFRPFIFTKLSIKQANI